MKQTGIFRALATAFNAAGAPRPQRHTTGAQHSQHHAEARRRDAIDATIQRPWPRTTA